MPNQFIHEITAIQDNGAPCMPENCCKRPNLLQENTFQRPIFLTFSWLAFSFKIARELCFQLLLYFFDTVCVGSFLLHNSLQAQLSNFMKQKLSENTLQERIFTSKIVLEILKLTRPCFFFYLYLLSFYPLTVKPVREL